MPVWVLRKHRCHFCGTRHITPIVWACGWLHIFAWCRQQTADSVYGSICVCVCIALWMQADKGQELCHPWFTCIWPKLKPGVKCDLSPQCFALCSEDKDIYWAAHNTALITDHQLYPLPCGWVINVASLAWDIFSVTPSLWFLSCCMSSHLLPVVSVIYIFFSVFIFQFIFSSASPPFWLVVWIKSQAFTYVLVLYLLVVVGESSM